MANEDAWNTGWALGMKSAARKKKTKGAADKTADMGKIVATRDLKAKPGAYKKGGKVRKTGMAKVHRGEIVLTAAQARMCSGKPTKKKGARKRATTKA